MSGASGAPAIILFGDDSLVMSGSVDKLREKAGSIVSETLGQLRSRAPDSIRKYILVLGVLSVPAFFFTRYFVAFALMVATLMLSLIVNSYDANSLGLELATFSTVTMGLVFPAEIGALLGFIYISLQIFSGSNPGIYMLWVVPSMTVAGYVIGNFSYLGPVWAGIYASVILQSFFVFMTFLTSRGRLPKFIQYVVFNLTFNFFLFKTFAEPLMRAVGGT